MATVAFLVAGPSVVIALKALQWKKEARRVE